MTILLLKNGFEGKHIIWKKNEIDVIERDKKRTGKILALDI